MERVIPVLYGGLLFSWVPKAGLLSVGRRVDHFPLYIRIGGGGGGISSCEEEESEGNSDVTNGGGRGGRGGGEDCSIISEQLT